MLKIFNFVLLGAITNLPVSTADVVQSEYFQQCQDDTGPPFVDDEPGVKYYEGSGAFPVLLEDGTCLEGVAQTCRKLFGYCTGERWCW